MTTRLTNDLGLGYVRVDEDFLGIVRLYLIRGGVEVVARRYGPAPAVSGAYRIFASSGEPVTDGVGSVGTVAIPALRADQVFDFTLTLTFSDINGGDAEVSWA